MYLSHYLFLIKSVTIYIQVLILIICCLSDTLAQMSFWSVSGQGELGKSLEFILRPENVSKSLAIILADISEPWTVLESLEKWTALINSFIDSLGIDPKRLKELEEKGRHASTVVPSLGYGSISKLAIRMLIPSIHSLA